MNQAQKLVDKRSQGNERNNVGSDDQNEAAGRQDGVAKKREERFLLAVGFDRPVSNGG